jgi:hypothetical protein
MSFRARATAIAAAAALAASLGTAASANAAPAADGGAFVSWPNNGGGAGSMTITWPSGLNQLLLDDAASLAPHGFCYTAQLSDIGWQWTVACMNDDSGNLRSGVAGVSGHRIEAIAFAPGPDVADMCMQAHVQNIGWQNGNCAGPNTSSAVGTVGKALQMEKLSIWASGLNFHVESWLTSGGLTSDSTCDPENSANFLSVGTTGQARGLVTLDTYPGC